MYKPILDCDTLRRDEHSWCLVCKGIKAKKRGLKSNRFQKRQGQKLNEVAFAATRPRPGTQGPSQIPSLLKQVVKVVHLLTTGILRTFSLERNWAYFQSFSSYLASHSFNSL